jgi:YHS domain-containing protein
MWSGGFTREGRGVLATAGCVIVLVGALAIGLSGGSALASEGKLKTEAKPQAAKPAAQETYPLDTCIVSGSKLGAMGDPVVYKYEGREIRFCCSGCISKFEKDPKTYLKKMDEAIIAKELPGYPLDTCVVTGDKLGANKEAPINYIYHNHLVRFSRSSSQKTFDKDPEKYLLKLDATRQRQLEQSTAQGHAPAVPAASKEAAPAEGKGSCGGH